jgi:hypothetical protein
MALFVSTTVVEQPERMANARPEAKTLVFMKNFLIKIIFYINMIFGVSLPK